MLEEVRPAAACLATGLLVVSMLAGAARPTADADGYTGLDHVASLPEIGAGAGIRIDGDHAYVPSYDEERFSVVDLTDPENATVVGTADTGGRDVAVVHHDDGRTTALVADNGDFELVDVTDPASPTPVATHPAAAHNVAVKPGTELAYVSTSSGDGGEIPVVDVSDPADPVTVAHVGDRGCHDLEFHQRNGSDRMVCAGVGATQIWNVSDPLDPTLVAEVTNPLISAGGFAGAPLEVLTPGLHHWATTARDGELLIIGDEYMGALGDACAAHAEAAGRSVSGPLGALWFYDLSDEDDPKLRGWFSPDQPATNGIPGIRCTAHFGEVIDGTDQLVTAWYRAGVLLVDFSDPSNPILVDRFADGTETWDARLTGDGYVVTGDLDRGSDVLELTGS